MASRFGYISRAVYLMADLVAVSAQISPQIWTPIRRYAAYGSATAENLRYAPPLAPLSDYLELAKLLGVERFVFVQPSSTSSIPAG